MTTQVILITSFQDLLQHEKDYAQLRGEYYIWNVTSRYEFNPEVFTKNLQRRELTLDDLLDMYERMKNHGRLSEARKQKLKHDFDRGQTLFLLFEGDRLVSCARLTRKNTHVAEIHSVYTKPQYRGKGYAKTVLNRLLLQAKREGYLELWLDTMPFMKSAIKLYQSLGFSQTEYLEMGYPSRVHATETGVIFMKMRLA